MPTTAELSNALPLLVQLLLEKEILTTEQIEGIFNLHPSVYRTALVGVDGEPVLWVELEPRARLTDRKRIVRELTALGQDHPQAAHIRTFLFLRRFPTDVRHNSKILRERLAHMAKDRLNRPSLA